MLATPAFASDPDTDGSFAGKHLLVFQDQEGTVSPQDVIAGKLDDRFSPSNKDIPNFGSTRSTIYALLEIKQSAPVWIELSHPILDEVDGFLIRKEIALFCRAGRRGTSGLSQAAQSATEISCFRRAAYQMIVYCSCASKAKVRCCCRSKSGRKKRSTAMTRGKSSSWDASTER